jgi:hypothetical protein
MAALVDRPIAIVVETVAADLRDGRPSATDPDGCAEVTD